MKICIFGGSTTWGEGDGVNGGWVGLLMNDFMKTHNYVYNLGVSGDTTHEMVIRAELEAKVRRPDVIIFSTGLNDSALISPDHTPRVPLEVFTNNIMALLKSAQKLNTKVMFIGPTSVIESKTTPIPWDTEKHYTNASAKQFDATLEEFCKFQHVAFVSIANILDENDISTDGLHPNTKGHEKIFETVKPQVEKLISQGT